VSVSAKAVSVVSYQLLVVSVRKFRVPALLALTTDTSN
jgi:hypothetical protein